MSATLKMKKWRDNFLQIPEGLRGHPMSELEEVASTLTAIVNMTDDSHIQDMAKFCITEVIAADKEIAARDAELARLREALDMPDGYVLLPVKPTYELVVAMAVKKWPDIWEKGKKLQMELGCGVVPPNAECEEAAGTYMQLIEALKSNDS